jgi:hypothetical protein
MKVDAMLQQLVIITQVLQYLRNEIMVLQDSVSGQKCETLPKFTHTSMSADEYQNAKITFLNDFSRVNTKQSFCFILTLQIPYKKCCIQKNHPLEIL